MDTEAPPTFVAGFHDVEKVKLMRYNKLGSTSLKVSGLSLGTGGFCNFYGGYSLEECKLVVEEAIKSGINYIDTGPWYGHGVAESVLGKCLENIPRKSYYIASKVGRYESDPKLMFDFSAAKTKESIEQSLERLGLDFIDVMQVHDVEFAPSLDIIFNQTIPTIQEFVKEGKVGYIGITGYPNSVLKTVIEKSEVRLSTILSYTRLTMVDQSLMDFIPFYESRSLGIINASIHGMGLLTNFGPQAWHPASEGLKKICRSAAEYCKENGVELGKLALHFAIQQKGPSTILIGINTRELLRMNLEVFHRGLSELEKNCYAEILKRYFTGLGQTHWEGIELKKFKENSFAFET